MDELRWTQLDGSIPEHVRDVSEEMGEGAVLIGGPDWVKTPAQLPENLKNRKMRINKKGWVDMRCPVCKAGGPVFVMVLEDELCVSCCAVCKQYGWFKEPRDTSHDVIVAEPEG